MISHKHKFIFIHVPKCAGTTVEKRLVDNEIVFDWNHKAQIGEQNPLPFGDLREKGLAQTIEKFSDYYLFTFCRNPWHRLISTYLHSKRGGDKGIFKRAAALGSFASFVEEARIYLAEQDSGKLSGFEKYHLLPQIKFIPKANQDFFSITMKSDFKIDFIGRAESFDLDLSRICKHLGLETQTNKKYNTSSYPHPWKDYYNDSLFNRVAEIYKEDISSFDYTNFIL